MEFTPITSQEQFDKMIGERLKRERESVESKYADYNDIKTKVADYEKEIAGHGKLMEEANKKIAGHEKTVSELNAKIKGYETASVKTRIAHEVGLNYNAIDFLKGDDEESIRKSAESLKSLIGKPERKAPYGDVEPTPGEGINKDAALLATLRNLNGKGE